MGSAAPDEKGEPLSTNENGSAEVPLPSSEPGRVGLWEWDLKTKQFYCSFEFRRQLGVGETEPIAGLSDLEARLHPGDQERVKKSLHKFLTSGEPSYETQYRLSSNDNSFHWMRLQAELIHDQSGQPSGIIGYQQDITMLKNAEKSLRALATRLQQVREEEAMRIARELHDQLGRCLAALKMDVDGIGRGLAGDESAGNNFRAVIERAKRMNQTIDETLQTVRRISAELRPDVLDDLGLAAAIEWQAKDFQARSGISCILGLPEEDLALTRDQATALFRIFQESLTNVARHARATKVWINLSEEEDAIVLEIEDDGVGISPDRLADRHSLGLLGARERVAVFGGEIEFSGVPGQGTVVVVRMPVRE